MRAQHDKTQPITRFFTLPNLWGGNEIVIRLSKDTEKNVIAIYYRVLSVHNYKVYPEVLF